MTLQDPQPRELISDDEDASLPLPTHALQSKGGSDSEDDTSQYTVVWDSSRSVPNPALPSLTNLPASHFKDRGNDLLKAGDAEGAVACYRQAAEACCRSPDGEPMDAALLDPPARQLLAVIYSNLAAALIKLKNYQEGCEAAQHAHALHPEWAKPLYRVAETHLRLGRWTASIAACLAGEALSTLNSEGRSEFTPLLDRAAVCGAAAGEYAGYAGRQLEVRAAGEEAWLGRPAPYDAVLDGPLDEDTALPSDDVAAIRAAAAQKSQEQSQGKVRPIGLLGSSHNAGNGSEGGHVNGTRGGGGALAGWRYGDVAVGGPGKARTSFRSIKEAVKAARDGDRIVLRRGIHNGMGESIEVQKRVLIEGEGGLGETVIDQRANCPTFRITRGGAVVRNLDLDHTGFREAVLVAGSADVAPLIHTCIIKCSGDDAVNVAGAARPTFHNCRITGKACGVRAFEKAAPVLDRCVLEKCGEQGAKAMESASVSLLRCIVHECKEEGVVAMQRAAVTLTATSIQNNKGPGVDCSDAARVCITGGVIKGNVGGVWLWDESTARVAGADLEGGPSQVILVDGRATVAAKECVIRGTVHASDSGWQGLLGKGRGNRLLDPEGATDFPPEEGPFKFVPNRFTRKQ